MANTGRWIEWPCSLRILYLQMIKIFTDDRYYYLVPISLSFLMGTCLGSNLPVS